MILLDRRRLLVKRHTTICIAFVNRKNKARPINGYAQMHTQEISYYPSWFYLCERKVVNVHYQFYEIVTQYVTIVLASNLAKLLHLLAPSMDRIIQAELHMQTLTQYCQQKRYFVYMQAQMFHYYQVGESYLQFNDPFLPIVLK